MKQSCSSTQTLRLNSKGFLHVSFWTSKSMMRTCAEHFANASPAAVLGTDRCQISIGVFVYGYSDHFKCSFLSLLDWKKSVSLKTSPSLVAGKISIDSQELVTSDLAASGWIQQVLRWCQFKQSFWSPKGNSAVAAENATRPVCIKWYKCQIKFHVE